MKRIILTFLILITTLLSFSQEKIFSTKRDSILIVKLKVLLEKEASLYKLINSNRETRDSVYLSITKQIKIENDTFRYEEFVSFKERFEEQYAQLIDTDNFPDILPIADYRKGRIVGFGKKIHPIYKILKFHSGIDLPAERGEPIRATFKGKVEIAKELVSGYGKHVVIKSSDGIKGIYANMDTILVKQDDFVEKGQLIGKVGSSGLSVKNHLHYEIWINGKPINPILATFDEFDKQTLKIIFTENGMTYD